MKWFISKDRAQIRNEEEEKAWKKYNIELELRDKRHATEKDTNAKLHNDKINEIHKQYETLLSDKENDHQKTLKTILDEKEISLTKINNEYSASLALEHKRVDNKIKELDGRIDKLNNIIEEYEKLNFQLTSEIQVVKLAKNAIIKFREKLGFEVGVLISSDGISNAEVLLDKMPDVTNIKMLRNHPTNKELI